MKRFSFIIGFLLPFLAVGLLNWLINPFLFFGHHVFAYPGGMKNPMERMEVAYTYDRLLPPNVILGTSRIKNIPAYPSTYWASGAVLNMSIASASIYEIEQYFEHVASSGTTRKALIGLDYDFFNWSPAPGFDSNRLHQYQAENPSVLLQARIQDTYRSLFSEQATRLSISYLTSERPFSVNGSITYVPGFIRPIFAYTYFPKASTSTNSSSADPLSSFQKILTIASDAHIDVTFVIPPVYAPYLEGKIGKKWDNYQKWKKSIVTLANAEELKSGQKYPIWDFSGFNSITKDVDGKLPNWYYDPSHFKSDIGMMILQKINGRCEKSCNVPSDFGTRLTPDMIDDYLRKTSDERNEYIKTMPKGK